MIPPLEGRIGRKLYWLKFLSMTLLLTAFVLGIAAMVSVVDPDMQRQSPADTVATFIFLVGFFYYLSWLVSIVVRRCRDIGQHVTLYIVLALIFTPVTILIGLIPGTNDQPDDSSDE